MTVKLASRFLLMTVLAIAATGPVHVASATPGGWVAHGPTGAYVGPILIDPNAPASYLALNQRVNTALAVPTGIQRVDDIEASLASAQIAMASAKERHQQTQNTLTDMLQQIEGISPEQVGSQILALQTSLQASLQVTAKLSQISLLNYL